MAKQKRRGKGGPPVVIPRISTPQPNVDAQEPHDNSRQRKLFVKPGIRGLRLELLVLLPALLLATFLYVNTLEGQFVYDDKPQIARNTLIQDSSNMWRAVFSGQLSFFG